MKKIKYWNTMFLACDAKFTDQSETFSFGSTVTSTFLSGVDLQKRQKLNYTELQRLKNSRKKQFLSKHV